MRKDSWISATACDLNYAVQDVLFWLKNSVMNVTFANRSALSSVISAFKEFPNYCNPFNVLCSKVGEKRSNNSAPDQDQQTVKRPKFIPWLRLAARGDETSEDVIAYLKHWLQFHSGCSRESVDKRLVGWTGEVCHCTILCHYLVCFHCLCYCC